MITAKQWSASKNFYSRISTDDFGFWAVWSRRFMGKQVRSGFGTELLNLAHTLLEPPFYMRFAKYSRSIGSIGQFLRYAAMTCAGAGFAIVTSGPPSTFVLEAQLLLANIAGPLRRVVEVAKGVVFFRQGA